MLKILKEYWAAWVYKDEPAMPQPEYSVPLDHKQVIERAVMLIETAWMDVEPIPCEVEAVRILKELLK